MNRRQPLDWLLFAVNMLGGATKAAKRIGVSKATVASWLRLGTETAKHGPLMRLAENAKIDINQFRLGPPKKG
jgi:hypothetical protein